jgi:4-amino-4-deoxy-L-arabinose transferase-like glycosyltransferase
MHFGSDEARTAAAVQEMAKGEKFYLLGPAAQNNRPDFSLGPFFYYLLVPGQLLFGSSPASGAWTVAIFSVISIFLVYFLARQFFGRAAGLMAAGLYATSFVMVYYGRWVWNPNVVPFFILLIFISLYKLTQLADSRKNEKYLHILAICFGIIIQLHGTALFILPITLILYFLIFRPKISWKKYLLALLIVAILNLPVIINELGSNFSNTRGLIRVLTQADSGASPGLASQIEQTARTWKNFWYESLLHEKLKLLFYGLLLLSLGYLAVKLLIDVRKRVKNPASILLALWLIPTFLVFIIYKEATPTHYFSLVFPLPFILLAGALNIFWKKRFLRVIPVVIALGLFGLQLYYSGFLLYDLRPNGSRASSYPVTLTDMEQAVDFIKNDVKGQNFNFQEQVTTGYDNSYRYLFSLQSIAPSQSLQPIEYDIFIGKVIVIANELPGQPVTEVKNFGNVTVVKISRQPLDKPVQ